MNERLRSAVQRGWRRLAGAVEPRIFPEASSAAGHWQRKVMNDDVAAYIDGLGPTELSAFEVSGSAYEHLPWRRYEALDYPEFDLCAPLASSTAYDVVVCEQVIEHVVDPRAAARNLRALCKPGGTAIVSTPFMIRVHELPIYGLRDYWRFTPRGLDQLLADAGFSSIEVRSWGNSECIIGNMRRWSEYRPWMPLRNEPDLPVQVWAFARP